MKKESKHRNWIVWLALGLSGIAIIISIIALCISCPHVPELGFDYQGILVGILALLTTALIGWQILTVWNIRDIQKEIKEEKNAMTLRSEENEVEINATLVLFYRELLKAGESEDLIAKFLMSYLYLILHEANLGDIQRCEREILSFSKDIERLKAIPIRKEYKEVLYRILKQICSKSPIRNTYVLIESFHELNFYDSHTK